MKKMSTQSSKTKRLLIILLLTVFVSLLFMSGCGKDEKKEEAQPTEAARQTPEPQKIELDATPDLSSQKWLQMLSTDMDTLEMGDAKTAASKVHVVSYHPQGQTRRVDEVDEMNITFSEPVAPLKKIDKDAPSLIEIYPHIKGEGYWKSSTTYCFRMDEKLKPSSQYRVSFKGYTAFSGKKIDQKTWSFNTPTITIRRTKPYHNKKWQTLDQKVLVQFSQDVDPDRMKEYIKITSDKGEHYFKIRYSNDKERKILYYWKTDRKNHKKFITITPKADYPIATFIKVNFLKGLPPLEGNIGLQTPRTLTFRTYERFEILSAAKEFMPDIGIRIEFSNPVPIKNFLDKIRFEPEAEINKESNWNPRVFHIHGKFTPGATYTMTVPADVEDQYSNELGEEKKYVIKCLDYSPYLYPPYPAHFVLENYLEKSIPVNVRNIFQSEVLYKKLSPEEIKKMTKSSYLHMDKIDLKTCSAYTWQIPVQKNRDYTLGFKLKNINITKPGFYFIYFSGTTRTYYPGHVFQLTDISLVAKYSPTQIFLMPFNMKSGEPVGKTNFKIYDFNAGAIKSDKSGLAVYNAPLSILGKYNLFDTLIFSGPKPAFIWGKKREMFDMWNYMYESGFDYNYNPDYFYDYLLTFTDKHLYKAGQTVKFKGILRQIVGGDMQTPRLKNIKVEVVNSRSQNIHKFTIKKGDFTRFGTFAGEFDLPEDAPTGFYRIHFKVALANSNFSKDLTFSVEEYKPAKFEVKVSFDQDRLIAGEDFSGRVNGRYLFGTPMIKAEGNCVWTIRNTYYEPKGWGRYIFGIYESHIRRTIFNKNFKLDTEGNYKYEKDDFSFAGKNSVRLTVHGEVKDKDNNRIGGSRSIIVHRGQYYIGLKTGSYFFKQNKPGKLFLVTVNPEGKIFKDTELDLKITREEWKSFQKKDASGALRWGWQKHIENILEEEVELPAGTYEKEYSFKKTGYYKVTVTGKDKYKNTITTTGNFYITGSGYVSWGVNEGRIIDLVTDKKKYQPGDTIELLIKSPFETSTALVTVEREKVMWSKVIRMKGNADTVKIPVAKDFMPNAFVNVIILKERTGLKWDEEGNDIGKPEFYAGYKELKIDAGEKELQVKVKADKTSYEPGGTVNLELSVTDKAGNPVEAEVCLSIVDKGVLNLVGYQLPNPFTFFWANRALDVKTVSTLNDVLGRREFKEKGEDPGGGSGESAFGSVVVRKNFKESAYYTAFLLTDRSGKAKVSFKLPDNLTTFKAMAAAGTAKDRFGRGSKDLLVKKKIILKPALTDFSRVGDKFSAGVTVTNNSDEKLDISVAVEAENIGRIAGDQDEKRVTLKPGMTRPVWFKFEVKSLETAKLTFKARGGPYQDGLYQEIPVRMPQFLEAAANFGRVDDKPLKEQVIVPGGTFRPLDNLEITLASSAMVGVKRNFDILQEFPYDCLEQRISKQMPLLVAGDFLLTYGLLDMSRDEINTRIKALLKLLSKYQGNDGAFKYYPDSYHAGAYLTCYAVEFIMEAKKRGYEIESTMLSRAQAFLKKVANHTVDFKYPYSKNICFLVQAYAVYALSMDNILMKDAVNNLFEVRDRIPFSGLACLLKALELKNDLPSHMQPVLAKTILNKMKDAPTMTHFENHEGDTWWWVHESNVKTTAIVLDALLRVYKKFPYAEKIARWLTMTTKQKRYMSTQEHIRLFLSFESYYRVFESETPDFVARVLFNDELKIKEIFSGRELKAKKNDLALKKYKPGDKINIAFRKEGTGMLYYLLRLKYYPLGEVEAIDRGFAVRKTYKTLKGAKIDEDEFVPGEKYIVEVKVTTDQERSFVILNDPVPAGLKVLNPRFRTGQQLDLEKANRDNKWGGYWGNFYRSEYYFDRVEVFADYLRRGAHSWSYLVIATNSGSYTVPNTVCQEMYNPEVFGRNSNRNIQVK